MAVDLAVDLAVDPCVNLWELGFVGSTQPTKIRQNFKNRLFVKPN